MSKIKTVYAIAVSFYAIDDNGKRRLVDFGVSSEAYDTLKDAKTFLKERCDEVINSGWRGVTTTVVSETLYEIRELVVVPDPELKESK